MEEKQNLGGRRYKNKQDHCKVEPHMQQCAVINVNRFRTHIVTDTDPPIHVHISAECFHCDEGGPSVYTRFRIK